MWIELPMLWIGLLNGLGIPLVHFGLSWCFTKLPIRWFPPGNFPYRAQFWESRKRYDRLFQLRAWKGLLPDAGPWFGGFAKKQLGSADPEFLGKFVAETCRSEGAHWAQWLAISGFVIWTPMPWAWVILIYAPLSNLPCILLQRQNRLRLQRILARRSK